MTKHPPHTAAIPNQPTEPDPRDSAADPAVGDLVAGDPPVPITVWRTPHSSHDTAGIPTRLAYRLIAAYSRPGEQVVDLTIDHALTGACTAGGRVHHRAWFTDTTGLTIAPATPTTSATTRRDAGEPPEVGAWFGDDLTDPDLPPQPEPAGDGPAFSGTSLIVASWPLDVDAAANRVRLAWLLTACPRLLRPGGCLVLIVTAPTAATTTPEDFSPLVEAAAAAGLGYLQHIVAVAADTDADSFVYHATDEELLTLTHTDSTVRHLRVHADLLVFTQPQIPAGSKARKAGGRRG